MKLSEKRGNMLHGILLIALFSCAAFYISDLSFVKSLSFSPLIVGIILGMLYANSLRNRLPETWGTRYPVLFEANSAIRYHIVWFQIDFPGRDGSRLTRHPDRYHRRNGDHLWRCTDREMDENGKRDYFTHFGR